MSAKNAAKRLCSQARVSEPERRFVWQARTAVLVVGLSGVYMTARLHPWQSFISPGFWWMRAMAGVWLLFAFVLFIVEPFILHGRFHRWANRRPELAFAWLDGAHWLLLVLALVTVVGAVPGSEGWSFF